MLTLQKQGAENINFVTPTHQALQIFNTLADARKLGLNLPVVYNCGGYENPDFLKELAGYVDIYMPDFKYSSDEMGYEYSGVKEYASYCKKALIEMQRQVGDLELNNRGVAEKGLLVRHLVLPFDIAGSKEVIDFLSENISLNLYLNIMDQYHPSYRASEFKKLRRRVLRQEITEIVEYAHSKGLKRVLS